MRLISKASLLALLVASCAETEEVRYTAAEINHMSPCQRGAFSTYRDCENRAEERYDSCTEKYSLTRQGFVCPSEYDEDLELCIDKYNLERSTC